MPPRLIADLTQTCRGSQPSLHSDQHMTPAGPAVSLDTACSSTLSATSLTSSMLWDGRCKQGLVTAALLTLDPATISMLTAANMLAPDGRCKTLDASADGFATALALALALDAISLQPLPRLSHLRPVRASILMPSVAANMLFAIVVAFCTGRAHLSCLCCEFCGC